MGRYHIIADLHTHTLASNHAYSTLTEMVQAAADRGLFAIAITDHAGIAPGAPKDWYFRCLRDLPLYHRGVLTVVGVEANILDFEGTLDVSDKTFSRLDWGIASIHHLGQAGLNDPDPEKSTHLWLQVAKNPHINVIGHSGDPLFPYDVERVIPAFGEHHKLVEINDHTFESRQQNVENCRKIALACKRHGVPIVVNSDAHFETRVGRFRNALKMLEEIDFPEELIVNASEKRLRDYLEQHTHIFTNRTYLEEQD